MRQINFVCPYCNKSVNMDIVLRTFYFFTDFVECPHCHQTVYLEIDVKVRVDASKLEDD